VLWDGTSAAAPLVSGLAALVKAAHPELDAANVINRIVATAVPQGEAGETVPGPIYGYGLIDAVAAVTASVAPVAANPMGDLDSWIATYRPASAKTSLETLTIPAPDGRDTEGGSPGAGSIAPEGGVYTLSHWAVPLGLLFGFLVLLTTFAYGAVSHFRGVLRK
jgi:subtilisin family serine protease